METLWHHWCCYSATAVQITVYSPAFGRCLVYIIGPCREARPSVAQQSTQHTHRQAAAPRARRVILWASRQCLQGVYPD